MPSLKDYSKKQEKLSGGHRACSGCAPANVLRQVVLATNTPLVCGFATGCMEVSTTIYPYTAWRVSYIHSAFENVAATVSGAETAYRVLKRRGKMPHDFRFIAIGGDGGTYDIGFQSLSGAMERGHNMVYICYDNQAYMNTGIQRSSSTPLGAATSTTPAGKVVPGKQQNRKDLTDIMTAHNIPYVAQTAVHRFTDLMAKVEKALEIDGPAFLNILAPCHRGWRIEQDASIEYSRVATDTCFWPLYEVEQGVHRLNYLPKEKKPVTDWIQGQGRFRHLFTGKHQDIIDRLQAETDRKWEELLTRTGGKVAPVSGSAKKR